MTTIHVQGITAVTVSVTPVTQSVIIMSGADAQVEAVCDRVLLCNLYEAIEKEFKSRHPTYWEAFLKARKVTK